MVVFIIPCTLYIVLLLTCYYLTIGNVISTDKFFGLSLCMYAKSINKSVNSCFNQQTDCNRQRYRPISKYNYACARK